ncbi:PREDICTED: uncharacterized protein LOC106149244 [Chinchilla lanigera]|uniref:uncharacterized protein LOC106149244 n=1 Tax=Chinchilla lanigera TaxID=34839 RepID=UPI00069650E4|nr:PREDICTED: uncharacterized protein LOC106149244 [Chinchilla lanigera]
MLHFSLSADADRAESADTDGGRAKTALELQGLAKGRGGRRHRPSGGGKEARGHSVRSRPPGDLPPVLPTSPSPRRPTGGTKLHPALQLERIIGQLALCAGTAFGCLWGSGTGRMEATWFPPVPKRATKAAVSPREPGPAEQAWQPAVGWSHKGLGLFPVEHFRLNLWAKGQNKQEKRPRTGTPESNGSSSFSFLRNLRSDFHSGCTSLHFHQASRATCSWAVTSSSILKVSGVGLSLSTAVCPRLSLES